MGVERPRLVIDFMQDMIKKGKLPKHLSLDKPRTGKSKTVFPDEPLNIDKFRRGLRAQKEDAVKTARAGSSIEKKNKIRKSMTVCLTVQDL